MRDTRLIMGMPIEIEIVASSARSEDTIRETLDDTFAYFVDIDERFSTYKEDSEISRFNRGELAPEDASEPMREMLALAEETRVATDGYFDIRHPEGHLDPSGIVKGYAIREAARRIRARGFTDFFVNAGGDIAASGVAEDGAPWSVGIRNPFAEGGIVKVVYPRSAGVATSGSYLRGAHIYDPHTPGAAPRDLVSLTVVGPDVFEADRFATAAFAMGARGAAFVESLPGFEAYAIGTDGIATLTSGFAAYTTP